MFLIFKCKGRGLVHLHKQLLFIMIYKADPLLLCLHDYILFFSKGKKAELNRDLNPTVCM